MARHTGISLRSVQRIWAAHDLQPHRIRTFKRSTDPEFAAKLEDIVGLYIDPPKHAVVLSVDEKSQIQALDRTQPGLPLKPGKAGTMTHDYLRNGVTTLFAAFDVLDGTVLGRCTQRHRHQEFLRFLNTLEGAVPAGKVIHVILDDYGSHKHPKVLRWLARHPRWIFHFTPTAGPQARQLPLDRRPAGRDQPLHRRTQRRSQAVHLDQNAAADPRQTESSECACALAIHESQGRRRGDEGAVAGGCDLDRLFEQTGESVADAEPGGRAARGPPQAAPAGPRDRWSRE
jgi:DDE superfamily endonuclease